MNFRNTVTETHARKLHNLGVQLKLTAANPDGSIFNLSNYVLSAREKYLLSFGFDFALPIFKLSFVKHFLSFERVFDILRNQPILHNLNINDFKRKLRSIAYKFYDDFKKLKVFSPIFNKNDVATLRTLADNKNLVFLKPDKGRGIIIINKNDYVAKMVTILADRTKFSKLGEIDPYRLPNGALSSDRPTVSSALSSELVSPMSAFQCRT